MSDGFCILCRTHKAEVHWNVGANGNVCKRCYRQHYQPRVVCTGCDRVTRVSAYKDDAPLCDACRRRARGRLVCSRCSLVRSVAAIDADGRPVCNVCRRKQTARIDVCSGCTRATAIRVRVGNEMYCASCYEKKLRPTAPCIDCGRMRKVSVRLRDGRALCDSCRARRATTARKA